jgi:hypothetical protein
MSPISEAIKNLEVASRILEQHAAEPQNHNAAYSDSFELISWEIYKHINEVKHISNIYGVL